jgi:GT2 family glycosyltransferase
LPARSGDWIRMDLSVIIVSYNTADLIGECLSSVLGSEGSHKTFVR